jgi:hypothetical protein
VISRIAPARLPEIAAKDTASYEVFRQIVRTVNQILSVTNVRIDDTDAEVAAIDTVLGDLSDESFVVLTVTADTPNARSLAVGSALSKVDAGAGSTVTLNVTTNGIVTSMILDANVTRAKLSNSAANSVIGRSANSAGVPADIAASVDGDVLRQSGTTTGFSQPTALVEVTLVNGANDDIAITGTETLRIIRIVGPSGAFSVSGFTAPSAGRMIVLHNTTAQAMTLTNDAGSTAANRILTLTGADIVLAARTSSATLAYDSTAARWIVASYN